MAGAIGERFFEEFAIFKLDGDVDGFWEIGGVEVELLEQRRDEFVGVEFIEVFPEKFAAIDDAAAAQVEEIRGDERGFGVEREDVGVVTLGLGDALALFDVFERAEEIAIGGGLLEEFFFGGSGHALFERFDEVAALSV